MGTQVTKDTWDAIVRFYPGSGPEITMVFAAPKGGVKNGYVDTSSWQVLQHDPPTDKAEGKTRKKRLERFRLKLMASNSNEQGAEEETKGQRLIGFGWKVFSLELYCVLCG